MYIPEMFILSDPAAIEELIHDNSFGLLVTAAPGAASVATHLPFLFEPDEGPHGTLHCHMARANPQWKDFAKLEAAGLETMVIFQGPHGYISPNWYKPGDEVPTWNYTAVHAYGPVKMVEDAGQRRAHQTALVETHEAGFPQPWSMAGQEEKYIARMLRGIVGFQIPIARVEAKAKLSQNKSEADRASVIAALEASGRAADRELAAVMRTAAGRSR